MILLRLFLFFGLVLTTAVGESCFESNGIVIPFDKSVNSTVTCDFKQDACFVFVDEHRPNEGAQFKCQNATDGDQLPADCATSSTGRELAGHYGMAHGQVFCCQSENCNLPGRDQNFYFKRLEEMSAESNPIKEYIEEVLTNRKAEEITELLFDKCKSPTIVGLEGHNFEHLNQISFIECDLESLDGLPKLVKVRVLDLSGNKLKNIEKLVESTPNLERLALNDNQIENVEQLEPLGKLKNLYALDVFNCPIATGEDAYQDRIFEVLPKLRFLDGYDVNGIDFESYKRGLDVPENLYDLQTSDVGEKGEPAHSDIEEAAMGE